MDKTSSTVFVSNHIGYRQISYQIQGEYAESFGDAWMSAGALAIDYEDFSEYQARASLPLAQSPFLSYTQQKEIIFDVPSAFKNTTGSAIPSNRLWSICVVHILLHQDDDWTSMLLAICAEGLADQAHYLTQTEIADIDWLKHSQEMFQPLILKKIAIVPHWHKAPEDRIPIQIDPGQAFGSGSHASTRMILEWLEIQSEALIAQKRILDYGSGSGILAITAAKLRANVSACDIDPTANQITKKNAEINQVTVQVFLPSACPHLEPFDIIFANILLQPLLSLESTFYHLLKPSGFLLMSGILCNQLESLQQGYQRWKTFHQITAEDSWALVKVNP